MHGRSSKYATADDKTGSSGGETGRRYPPRRDVLIGRVTLLGSEPGSSSGCIVEAGNSSPADGEVDA